MTLLRKALGLTASVAVLGLLASALPAQNLDAAAALADSITGFACDLFRAVASPSANLILSPYSIASAFAMARAGAAGETARQMDAVLRLPTNSPQAYRLLMHALSAIRSAAAVGDDGQEALPASIAVANGLFSQQGWSFRPAFRQTVADDFGGEFAEVDFGSEDARTTINRWVESKTRHRILDLIPAGLLERTTRMVLASAIHFKASWAAAFLPESTAEAPFFVTPARTVRAPRMRRTGSYRYAEATGVQVVALPYLGRDTSMWVVLPREKDGLDTVVESLSREKLHAWAGAMRERPIALELPRFTFTFQLDLVGALKQLGMTAAFESTADFTGLSTEKPLFISAALHKAYVAVDEKGTEAAAATSVVVQKSESVSMLPEKPVPFVADHPFLFLIRHQPTGEILFLGQVVDPTSK